MLPAWATIVLTLGGVALGAVLGAAGSLITNVVNRSWAKDDHDRAQASERAQRGAEVLAPVGILLSDANPDVLAFNVKKPSSYEVLSELRSRWIAIREPLAIYGNSHPHAEIPRAVEFLITAVANALTSAEWLIADILRHESDGVQLRVAQIRNMNAREILGQLVHAVRHEDDVDGTIQEISELHRIATAEIDAASDPPLEEAAEHRGTDSDPRQSGSTSSTP